MPVSNTFVAGDVITAAQVNANFDDLENELTGITGADMAANAGIVSTQITDRFSIVTETIVLTGHYLLQDSATLSINRMPNNSVEPGTPVARKVFTLRSGRAYYLCAISIHCEDLVVGSGTVYPQIWVQHNGVTLGGGAARIVAADTTYHLRNSNPLDNPLCSLANDSYITIGLGTSGSATDASVKGLAVTLTYKMEISA